MKIGVTAFAAVVGLGACGPVSGSRISPQPTIAASPTPTPIPTNSPACELSTSTEGQTIVDSKYCYSFRLPTGGTDVSQAIGSASGSHDVTNRPALLNPFQLGASDWWLVVTVAPPHAVVGCSEPTNADERGSTRLGDQSATRFVRKGTQHDPQALVIDVIATRDGLCYGLQLISGYAISEDSSKSIMSGVQASFTFRN